MALTHCITAPTTDLEATRDFYRDILGLRVGFRPDLDYSAIGGPSDDTGPFDHFAFPSGRDDLAVEVPRRVPEHRHDDDEADEERE